MPLACRLSRRADGINVLAEKLRRALTTVEVIFWTMPGSASAVFASSSATQPHEGTHRPVSVGTELGTRDVLERRRSGATRLVSRAALNGDHSTAFFTVGPGRNQRKKAAPFLEYRCAIGVPYDDERGGGVPAWRTSPRALSSELCKLRLGANEVTMAATKRERGEGRADGYVQRLRWPRSADGFHRHIKHGLATPMVRTISASAASIPPRECTPTDNLMSAAALPRRHTNGQASLFDCNADAGESPSTAGNIGRSRPVSRTHPSPSTEPLSDADTNEAEKRMRTCVGPVRHSIDTLLLCFLDADVRKNKRVAESVAENILRPFMRASTCNDTSRLLGKFSSEQQFRYEEFFEWVISQDEEPRQKSQPQISGQVPTSANFSVSMCASIVQRPSTFQPASSKHQLRSAPLLSGRSDSSLPHDDVPRERKPACGHRGANRMCR